MRILTALLLAIWPGTAIAATNEAPGLGFLMLKSVAGLAAVLALFALAIWLIRRFQPGLKTAGGNMLAIEQRINLDGKSSVAVVRCDNRRWLIGISPASLVRIDELESNIVEDQPQTDEYANSSTDD